MYPAGPLVSTRGPSLPRPFHYRPGTAREHIWENSFRPGGSPVPRAPAKTPRKRSVGLAHCSQESGGLVRSGGFGMGGGRRLAGWLVHGGAGGLALSVACARGKGSGSASTSPVGGGGIPGGGTVTDAGGTDAGQQDAGAADRGGTPGGGT